jgi:hypothetical protein
LVAAALAVYLLLLGCGGSTAGSTGASSHCTKRLTAHIDLNADTAAYNNLVENKLAVEHPGKRGRFSLPGIDSVAVQRPFSEVEIDMEVTATSGEFDAVMSALSASPIVTSVDSDCL